MNVFRQRIFSAFRTFRTFRLLADLRVMPNTWPLTADSLLRLLNSTLPWSFTNKSTLKSEIFLSNSPRECTSVLVVAGQSVNAFLSLPKRNNTGRELNWWLLLSTRNQSALLIVVTSPLSLMKIARWAPSLSLPPMINPPSTVVVDELCEMDLDLQTKLLRFIQTGSFQKVGSNKTERVDVRFICATNKDPLAEVKAGNFREDLFYRLHVIPIHLPPPLNDVPIPEMVPNPALMNTASGSTGAMPASGISSESSSLTHQPQMSF